MLGVLLRIACTWAPGEPTGWLHAPGAVEEFPHYVNSNGTTTFVVDPWRYADRLGAYKTMLASATALHFDGPADLASPLWGLPLQFSWQHDTGRLVAPQRQVPPTPPRDVSTYAWWGAMNYALSIVPFAAALEAGVVAPLNASHRVEIAKPPPSNATTLRPPFCTSFATCSHVLPNATAAWLQFFTACARSSSSTTPLNLSTAISLMWNAHIHSLHSMLPLAAPLQPLMPSTKEAKFGSSWAQLVDFVAAMHVDVDYNGTNTLQGLVVPPRVLRESDVAPWIKDFSKPENRALFASDALFAANTASDGAVLALFKRVCCTAAGRVDAYAALVGFLKAPVADIGALLKVLEDLLKSHPCY